MSFPAVCGVSFLPFGPLIVHRWLCWEEAMVKLMEDEARNTFSHLSFIASWAKNNKAIFIGTYLESFVVLGAATCSFNFSKFLKTQVALQ